MKTLLIIISQSPLQGQLLLESLSAVMVLATYGIQIKIVLTGDGIGLLRVPLINEENTLHPFKSAHALIESFEFYDLLPIWVDQTNAEQHQSTLSETMIEYELVELNSAVLGSYDGVLRW
ncbi:DsrE family protein [Aquirhabdus parva]|uniref:Uncharacterized protein n=1 Tax=Aquirhabdus parva TaxID=2283318 RepID=A0A345P623_9GAMM|nr:DsrE family protein [Aquirhabdus parva]AXI02732.1 hypothetical protein HYN46_07725 [Aquirhabdus parva]